MLGLTAFLTACAMPEGEFPSLARRPYEIDGPNSEPVIQQPAPPTVLPADLSAKVKALTERHSAADAGFSRGLPFVRRAAAGAAGSAPGSEKWVNAHLELSRLDNARADSVDALSELDKLIAEQVDGDSVYVTLLSEVQTDIANEVNAQRTEIDALSQQIGE